ncbi:hypothetical protein ACWDUD_18295 [Rhodococcus sp. NPDC003382]|jgi:hypothetical protein|uniref:Uncharacterized protein n=1 Tax=Rhodococcus rhodochrous TaxID=1829 RepID=A0AA46WZS8_RHORH|nr:MULTISPECIES: hypothetical protein [Rhodococcus]MBH0120976.1 hypothetical protein [Rhodococcus sp. CX]MCK8674037.1 hypothetical protein [Rhodococcus sp. HM1]UZF46679.1 hypothetical protein KUM34_008440 [Rhodococcus rhodochrous]
MTDSRSSSREPEPTADFGAPVFAGTEIDQSVGFDDSPGVADVPSEEGAHALEPCSEGDIPTASVADLIRQYTPEG